ncbi:MAG: PQQ-dependent sugar dehydrogenase [Planctomycetaceae bacterium]
MPSPRSLLILLSPLLLTAILVPPVPAAEPVDPSRFETTPLVTGMRQPMELAIAPDGTVFYIELEGKLKAWSSQSNSVRLVGELKVTTEQENGLIGLALDPNFSRNQWVYLQYSPPDFPGQHISRFTLVDGQLDLASEKLLLKYEEQRRECCHHAGSMQFGPNGDLFIGTGDNTNPFNDSQSYAPIDERPGREPWDAQKSSANTNSYNGKILRIRPTPEGGYEIPEGNLFPRDGSQGRPEIYVMGCRNPWRINVDQATGYLYWGDVGPDAQGEGPRGPRGYDEVNQARQAGNFGWPYFIANNQAYAWVNFATGEVGPKFDPLAPANNSPNNTGAKILPPAQPAFLYYPYGASPEFPDLGTGGRTACAGPVYHFDPNNKAAGNFPAAYDNCLFIYEWSRNWIKVVHLDDQQNVARIESFLPQQRFVRPIDMAFGSDGAMYLIEYGETWGLNTDARLVRIDYIAGNRTPVAVAAAENNIGKHPLAVKLTSQGSLDKDPEDSLAYEWRLIQAANPTARPQVLSTEPNPTITIDQPGVYNLELVVTDNHGASRSAAVPVVVGNARPMIRFLHPQPGDFFDPTQPITYSLEVDDAEDGTNDFDAVEQQDKKPIDPASPGRVSLNAVFTTGPLPSTQGGSADDQGPAGMKRMKRSDCFNCHAVDQPRVGPPLLEVAKKYRGKEGALEASVERVLKGSTGAWGKIPMIPHSQHTVDEVREMVQWIYSLEPSGLVRVFEGFNGEIPVSAEEAAKPGYYRLEATYVDRGAGDIPPLNTSATLFLRRRLVDAETADEIRGPQKLASGTAHGGAFIGAINHDHVLRFNQITLDKVKQLKLRVASAGAGGTIEIRRDAPGGELLASVPVEVNGEWEKWYEKTVAVKPSTGRCDLFVRFVNPQNRNALMNLDSIDFQPE